MPEINGIRVPFMPVGGANALQNSGKLSSAFGVPPGVSTLSTPILVKSAKPFSKSLHLSKAR